MTAAAEMPEDIIRAAERVHVRLLGRGTAFSVKVIAEAILAERQRDQWQPIVTAPQNGTRIILMWEPFGGISEHVELGRWSERSGWVNTYGHAFTGYPTHWMPLPVAPKGGA